MRTAVARALLLVGITCGSRAEAERAVVTTWSFEGAYSDGRLRSWPATNDTLDLPLHPDSSWLCRREPVRLGADGLLRGGFRCHQKGTPGYVIVVATCSPGKPTDGLARATIGDIGRVELTAACMTRAL